MESNLPAVRGARAEELLSQPSSYSIDGTLTTKARNALIRLIGDALATKILRGLTDPDEKMQLLMVDRGLMLLKTKLGESVPEDDYETLEIDMGLTEED